MVFSKCLFVLRDHMLTFPRALFFTCSFCFQNDGSKNGGLNDQIFFFDFDKESKENYDGSAKNYQSFCNL